MGDVVIRLDGPGTDATETSPSDPQAEVSTTGDTNSDWFETDEFVLNYHFYAQLVQELFAETFGGMGMFSAISCLLRWHAGLHSTSFVVRNQMRVSVRLVIPSVSGSILYQYSSLYIGTSINNKDDCPADSL